MIATECLARAYSHKESTMSLAIPLFEKLFEKDKSDENIANELIKAYKRTGEIEKAENVYVQLMNSAPDEPHKPYYQRISNLYVEAGKPEGALQWDLKALDETPDNPFCLLRVGQRYEQLGQNDKAAPYYEDALKKTTKDSDKELMSIELIDFYINASRLEDARKLADDLLAKSTDPVIRKETETRLTLIKERLSHLENHDG